MSIPVSAARYSAIIKGELRIGDRTIRLAQVGPEFVIVDAALELPPGPAILIIDVDGEITRREIDLPHGAPADSCIIPIVRR